MTEFDEEVKNVIDCLEYWEKRVGECLEERGEVADEEDESVMTDTGKALEFLKSLKEIVFGSCVLACYAGEDWSARPTDYGFGADSYEYLDEYLKGGMEFADYFGSTDFYNDYSKYFRENIKPSEFN